MSVLVLIDLNSQASWEFQIFPENLKTNDKVNWKPQETTTGVKPLYYGNQDPRRLSFPELWLDNTDTGESLTEILDELRTFLTEENETTGMPPRLLVTWGSRKEVVVCEDLTIEETFFDGSAEPLRAKVSLELIRIQPEGEGSSVIIGGAVNNEDVEPG